MTITVAAVPTSSGGGGHSSGTSTSTNYFLPIVEQQQSVNSNTVTVQKTFGITDVQVQVPQGALSMQEQLTITTGTLAYVKDSQFAGMTAGNTPLFVGVYFSGTVPQKPVTITITAPSIPADAKLYKLIPGVGYEPLTAQVSQGKIVASFA